MCSTILHSREECCSCATINEMITLHSMILKGHSAEMILRSTNTKHQVPYDEGCACSYELGLLSCKISGMPSVHSINTAGKY